MTWDFLFVYLFCLFVLGFSIGGGGAFLGGGLL